MQECKESCSSCISRTPVRASGSLIGNYFSSRRMTCSSSDGSSLGPGSFSQGALYLVVWSQYTDALTAGERHGRVVMHKGAGVLSCPERRKRRSGRGMPVRDSPSVAAGYHSRRFIRVCGSWASKPWHLWRERQLQRRRGLFQDGLTRLDTVPSQGSLELPSAARQLHVV